MYPILIDLDSVVTSDVVPSGDGPQFDIMVPVSPHKPEGFIQIKL